MTSGVNSVQSTILTDFTNSITLNDSLTTIKTSPATSPDYVKYVQKVQLDAFSLIGSSNGTMTPEMIKELMKLQIHPI